MRWFLVVVLWLAIVPQAVWADVIPDYGIRLPSPGAVAASSGDRWVLGVSESADAAVARRLGARVVPDLGAWTTTRAGARRVAEELRRRGWLRYAHPAARLDRTASFDGQTDRWARAAVVGPGSVPPAGAPAVAVIDSFVDPETPDLRGRIRYANATASSRVENEHGTMVASVIAGAADGTGVTGVLPTAQIVSYGLSDQGTCVDSAIAIVELARAGVRVINASYGNTAGCEIEYEAIIRAYGLGAIVVASAGNDGEAGNPITYPAAFPHVLSVAADTIENRSARFSNANAAVDLSAPGVGVPVALPLGADRDGNPDGVTLADGTSFSAPMVSAGLAWVLAARPELAGPQAADLLRENAVDLEEPGWDPFSGYGRLNIDRAVNGPAPRLDPLEPNDTVSAIDGQIFAQPDRPIWGGTQRATIRATVDAVEDPVDIYRLRVPPRARYTVLMRPTSSRADAELAAYDQAATAVRQQFLIDRSLNGPGEREALYLRNPTGRTRTVYIAVTMADSTDILNTNYVLEVLRRRR